MHSGRAEFDSRVATATHTPSRGNTASASRPTTSISSLTARENLRLEKKLDPLIAPRLASPLLSTRQATPGPNDLDFKRVLERLNRITVQGGVDSRKLVLTDDKPVELLLDYNDTIFIRVPTFHQLSPLTISIKRSKGKLTTYVSKTIPEPMEALCDCSFRGDIVTIADLGPKFKCKSVFLAITAQEESVFTVKAHFGRTKPLLRITNKLLPQDTDEVDWMALLPQPSNKTKSCKTLRNFVEENQQLRLSPTFRDLTDRKEAWKHRRETVLRRFRENLSSKRSKALNIINKREIQRLERLRIAKEADLRTEKQRLEKKWLTFMAFSRFLDSIEAKITVRKAEIAAENFGNSIARKIQRKFRRLMGSNSRIIALNRALHGFQLMLEHTFIPFSLKIAGKIISCVRSAHKNASIRRKFQQFYRSGTILHSFNHRKKLETGN